ncbi:hypothetical protein ABZW30_21540 [Kitasatospora sp. NPDC004669]|uniref:hypothetical protein n=1 Tax=Kitasatospora sp. NPDC004669 TaxID=3154555 RepID=UPI0033BE3C58
MREGQEVRILRKDLAHLVPWMPSLEQTVADIAQDAPHWDFTVFQPRADDMAIANVALSTEWPAWSKKQARAARSVCAVCDYDRRWFKDETRMPFDIRLPERPKARRLVCGAAPSPVPGSTPTPPRRRGHRARLARLTR